MKSGQQARFPRLWISLTDLAEQRLGSPWGPLRGTAGWGRQHCRTAPSQTGCPSLSWLFLQPNNSQSSNCQIRNTRTSTASVIPILESWQNAEPVLPKPALSPVPPDLSGPDQAWFTSAAYKEPRSGPRTSISRGRPCSPDQLPNHWQPRP